MLSPRAFTLNKDAASEQGIPGRARVVGKVRRARHGDGDAGDAGSQRISLAMPSIKIVF